MKIRNPEWPDYFPLGPDNPLGTHALYLSWQYYRVHGTGDTRKIGRQSSNGCIGVYNEHIKDIVRFGRSRNTSEVVLIHALYLTYEGTPSCTKFHLSSAFESH